MTFNQRDSQHLQTIYSENLKLDIEKIISLDKSKMITKTYTFYPGFCKQDCIDREYEFLKYLQSKANEFNCFLSKINFESNGDLEKKLSIEVYDETIKDIRKNKIHIDKNIKYQGVKALLLSFVELTNYGCYNANVSTESIYVDPSRHLKLKHFIPVGYDIDAQNRSGTNIYGGKQFMAPELIELSNNPDCRNYDQEKACVFSLGLCIYEFFTYEDSIGLNLLIKEALSNKLNSCSSRNIRDLLDHMLEPDPQKRLTFKECYDMLINAENEPMKYSNLLVNNISLNDFSGKDI